MDLDGDGHCECYYYTDDPLRIVTTGNVAAALATDRDSLRQLFRTSRHPLLAEPTLAHVDYPNVYVRTAEYRSPVLRFTVLKGQPSFRGTTEIVCQQIPPQATVSRDGKPLSDFQQTGSTLRIRTDVETEHVFEVAPDSCLPMKAPSVNSTVIVPASTGPASVEQRLAASAPGAGFLAPHRPRVGGSRDCTLDAAAHIAFNHGFHRHGVGGERRVSGSAAIALSCCSTGAGPVEAKKSDGRISFGL